MSLISAQNHRDEWSMNAIHHLPDNSSWRCANFSTPPGNPTESISSKISPFIPGPTREQEGVAVYNVHITITLLRLPQRNSK